MKDHHFDTSRVVSDLKRLVLRGGLVKVASQCAKFLLRVGGLVIMARLISPEDYGIFAMVATFTNFLMLSGDMGLSTATVQSREITHEQISTLFWVNVAIGSALATITAAAAPALAWFYGEPRIVPLACAIGATFILDGAIVQHKALLIRQMRIATLETIALASQVLGFAAMLASALKGGGYWALVANVVVMNTTGDLMVWYVSGWRPSWPRFDEQARGMLTFGRHLSGFRLVDYLHRNLDNMMIGRFWGAEALGLYGKAYGLLRVPLQQMEGPASSVVVPALSRLQDNPKRYRSYLLHATKAIVVCGMPVVVFTFIDARVIMLTLLGPRWLGVVPIFKALAPAAFFATTNMLARWILVSTGRPDLLFKTSTAMLGVLIVAFSVGVLWGPVGVALSYSLAYCLFAPLIAVYALRRSPVSPEDLGRAIWRPVVVSLASGFAADALRSRLLGFTAPAAQLIFDAVVFGVLCAGLWAVVPGGRKFIVELARPVIELLQGPGRGASAGA